MMNSSPSSEFNELHQLRQRIQSLEQENATLWQQQSLLQLVGLIFLLSESPIYRI